MTQIPQADRDLLLFYSDMIRAELGAPELDVAAAILSADIQLLRACEVRGKDVHYVGPRLSDGLRPLFARIHEGAGIIVAVSSQLNYEYQTDAGVREYLEAAAGHESIEAVLAGLRERSIEGAFSAKKLAKIGGRIDRYGRALYPRPYLGQMIWMEPAVGARMHWSVVDRTLQDALAPDIDAVLDLGCGDGSLLLRLAVDSRRRDVAFFGCEISKSARACVATLAKIAGLENVQAVQFDLRAPDFSFLKPYRRVLAISHIALVYGVGGSAVVWQRLLEAVPEVRACLFETVSFAIPGMSEQPLFHRQQADQYGFDPEVFPAISRLVEAGKIRLVEVIPDFVGLSRLAPVSLIRFETA